ncbi:hypothetical protein KY284_030457 [Solanum tuberosum]|nr:hypothetical protein KY284_030457 [Solanum tuberosum]
MSFNLPMQTKVLEGYGILKYLVNRKYIVLFHPLLVSCPTRRQSYVGEVLSASKLVKRGNATFVRMLVQWTNLSLEDATLEDYKFIKAKFPDFDS